MFKWMCLIGFANLLIASFTGCSNSGTNQKEQAYLTHKSYFNINSIDDLYSFFNSKTDHYPIISAHRGGPAQGYPENALPTFKRIARTMPAIIECDIGMSKDSILVLIHDETLDRTTNGSGSVNNKTFDELLDLRLKDPDGTLTEFRIPTLEDALLWGKDKVIFTLDVKRSVPYEKVIDVIRETKAEHYSVIITYSADQTALVNKLAPDLMISATIKTPDDLTRLRKLDIPTNRLVAFVGTSEPDPLLYHALEQQEIKPILGTIGNLDRSAARAGYQQYSEHIARGARILSTDRPFDAQKALDFYIQSREIKSSFIHQ